MNIDDGGPAFPVTFDHGDCRSETTGMSLRDWFAGKAMAGLLADPQITSVDAAVETAYQAADAMLKAREAKP